MNDPLAKLKTQLLTCMRNRDLKRIASILDPSKASTPELATFAAETIVGESFAKADEMLRLVLARGADPDHGNGALVMAASGRVNATLLHILLEAGANPNPPGRAPVLSLAIGPNGQIPRVLLEHGADPNALNEFGVPPLFQAVSRLDIPLTEMLLSHGANPLFISDNGDSLLHVCASAAGSPPEQWWEEDALGFCHTLHAMARLLGEHGVPVGHQNKQGLSALDMAREAGGFDPQLARAMEEWCTICTRQQLDEATPTAIAPTPRRSL